MIALALAAALASGAPVPSSVVFDQNAMARHAAVHAAVGPRRLAVALRDRLAEDPVKLAAELTPRERMLLEGAVGPIDENAAPLLRRFAAGAMVRDTPAGVTGLYNPLSDAWLILSWLKTAQGPALYAVNLVDGADLRGDGKRWWSQDGAYADALGGAWKASAAAFDAQLAQLPPISREDDADVAAIAGRLARQEAAVRLAARDAALSGALERGRQASIVHPAADGVASEALQVAALPASVRRSMALALVIKRPGGVSGAYVTPAAPGLLLFIDLDAGNAPRGVTVVNLSETQP